MSGALDNLTQSVVTRTIVGLDVTRIVIAHRLSTIASADRVVVIADGRVVQDGPYSELAATPGPFADLIARQQLSSATPWDAMRPGRQSGRSRTAQPLRRTVGPMRTRLVVSSVLAVSGVVAACGSGSPNARQPEQDAPIETLTSIVQLGDSIASGEGTLYGYTWDAAAARWTGGNVDAKWPEPFPDCHTSDYAYGTIVATYFGAELNQFACTGSTFANGIIAPRTTDGTEYRPAQFGDWDARTDLNGDYDAAAPQLVMITLGADDLQFANIVEQCIENGYEYYWDLAELECVDHNPGSTIETDFVQFLPTLERNYATLIQWIKDRATANEAPEPKIIVTNYANPLPPDGAVCNDTNYLYEDQIKYLSSLVDQINGIIDETITGLDDPDVAVADISGAYTPQGASHIWCSDDPWAYGLSIYSVSSPSSFESLAPFHPTPDGQESLAEHVIPVVRQWFAPSSDETPGTSPTTEPSTAPTTTS